MRILLAVMVVVCASGCMSISEKAARDVQKYENDLMEILAPITAQVPSLTRQYFNRDDIQVSGVRPGYHWELIRWDVAIPQGITGYMVYTADQQLYFRRTYAGQGN